MLVRQSGQVYQLENGHYLPRSDLPLIQYQITQSSVMVTHDKRLFNLTTCKVLTIDNYRFINVIYESTTRYHLAVTTCNQLISFNLDVNGDATSVKKLLDNVVFMMSIMLWYSTGIIVEITDNKNHLYHTQNGNITYVKKYEDVDLPELREAKISDNIILDQCGAFYICDDLLLYLELPSNIMRRSHGALCAISVVSDYSLGNTQRWIGLDNQGKLYSLDIDNQVYQEIFPQHKWIELTSVMDQTHIINDQDRIYILDGENILLR